MSRDRDALSRLAALLGALACAALAVAAHAQPAATPPGTTPPASAAGPSPAPLELDPQLAARVQALDCDAVDAASVRDVLAHAPAPRVMLLSGSLPQITMDSFARFLIAMGYPQARLRDPRDGSFTVSGYQDSVKLAGLVAWHYEHDGMAPMLIGHSRGGMLVVRTLHELAGSFQEAVPVWDPLTDEPLPRTTIVDPYTRATRPVVGLSVSYAAAIATGKLPRLLLGQWTMLQRLRDIPDSVDDFTGFRIEGDLIAGDVFGADPYVGRGRAHVRNVTLPATYSHVGAVRVEQLAADPVTRAWIEAWRHGATAPLPTGVDTTNLLHAADIWYGVRRAWCRNAQRSTHKAGAP